VPLGRAGVGHRLDNVVFDLQRGTERLGDAANFLVPCRQPYAILYQFALLVGSKAAHRRHQVPVHGSTLEEKFWTETAASSIAILVAVTRIAHGNLPSSTQLPA
jgi:hypothetical protein